MDKLLNPLEEQSSEIDEIKEYIDYFDNVEIIHENSEYIIVRDVYLDIKLKIAIDFLCNNTKMLEDNIRLKYFENRGFKLGNYVEIFLNYYHVLDGDRNYELNDFMIDEVSVSISQPTDLFRMILHDADSDDYFDADKMWTLSLSGITENNYEEYLNNAIFILGYYNPSIEYFDYPTTYEFMGESLNIYANENDDVEVRRSGNKEFESKKFCKIKHHEALSFYNAAMKIFENEISFIFFYRVLEHFFLFVRQNEFINLIDDYNKSERIDDFIENVTKIYSYKEEFQLLSLLESIEDNISQLIGEAKENNIISNLIVSEFSNKLYSYRNSIVHGKNDTKLFVKTPCLVNNNEEMFWNKTVKSIAEVLILKYL